MNQPPSVLHVITTLDIGGAEMMLYKLLAHVDRSRSRHRVVCLSQVGAVGELIRSIPVPVEALNMRPSVPNPVAAWRLRRLIQSERATVVHAWMHHANLLGGLVARWCNVPVVWTIHDSRAGDAFTKRATMMVIRANRRLSYFVPHRIVCVSQTGLADHVAFGYDGARMSVIPNGYDVGALRPDHGARAAVRAELGLPSDAFLIGLIGRYHPKKDHKTFIEAARRIASRSSRIYWLLCGLDVTWENGALTEMIDGAQLRERFRLLGVRSDIPRIDAALDLVTSSSVSESFSIAIGEAMACGVPAVVTDQGDSRVLVGDTGRIVPRGDPDAIAGAWWELFSLSPAEREALGRVARARIEAEFSLSTIAGRYEQLYAELARQHSQGSPSDGSGGSS